MVGVDIIQISRIDKMLKRKSFFDKFFTDYEKRYIEEKNMSKNTIAGLISAKEAVSKAFGVGISKELGLLDIEVMHGIKGNPYINQNKEKIKKIMQIMEVENIHISISHDGDYCICFCSLS